MRRSNPFATLMIRWALLWNSIASNLNRPCWILLSASTGNRFINLTNILPTAAIPCFQTEGFESLLVGCTRKPCWSPKSLSHTSYGFGSSLIKHFNYQPVVVFCVCFWFDSSCSCYCGCLAWGIFINCFSTLRASVRRLFFAVSSIFLWLTIYLVNFNLFFPS